MPTKESGSLVQRSARPSLVTDSREARAATAAPVAWFALRLRNRFEFAVQEQLRQQEIGEFLPTLTQETRWSDRTSVTTRPLFPGYIFARFDPATRADVLRIRGVVQILSVDQQPVAIPDDQVANLQRFVSAAARIAPGPYVAVGATVRVARGPFAGVEGLVTRTKGAVSLTISVELLGRSVSVALNPADVEEVAE